MALLPSIDRTIPQILAGSPYFDDFDENKRFHRILFRAGYPIQNRELIQLQTILQNQIDRVGSHVFKQGSQVIPGEITYDNNVKWIAISKGSLGLSTNKLADISSGKCMLVASASTSLQAKIIDVLPAVNSNDTCHVFYIKYISSATNGKSEFENAGGTYSNLTLKTEGAEDTAGLTVDPTVSPVNQGTTLSSYKSGTKGATVINIADGVYFVHGYFVKVLAQSFIAEAYDSSSATFKAGLRVQESVVTEYDDVSLVDNANTRNYTAPGAHRLHISLTLTKVDVDSEDSTDFVELIRFKNGQLEYILDRSEYAYLGDELARRTFDESGSYTVRPFTVYTRELEVARDEQLDPTSYQVEIDPGKAYVKGYEITKLAKTLIKNDKAQTYKVKENDIIPINYGNFVFVKNVKGLLNLNNPTLCGVKLYNTTISKISVTTASPDNESIQTLNATGIGTNATCGAIVKGTSASGIIVGVTDANNIVVSASTSHFHNSDVVYIYGKKGTEIGTAYFKNLLLEDGPNGVPSENIPGEVYSSYALYLHTVNLYSGYKFENVSYIERSGEFSCHVDHFPTKLTGTITIGSSSPTVTGYNTRFLSELSAGDFIQAQDGTIVKISSVNDDFSLTLTEDNINAITNQTYSVLYADLQGADDTLNLVPLNKPIIKDLKNGSNVTDYQYYVNQYFSNQTVSTPAQTVTVGASVGDFVSDFSDTNYIVSVNGAETNYEYLQNSLIDLDPGDYEKVGDNLVISNIPDHITSINVLATVVCTEDRSYRTKTVVDGSVDITTSTEYTKNEIELIEGGDNHYDLISLTSVIMSGPVDITDRFELDTGARDGYFTVPKLIRKHGYPAPTAAITVSYKYYSHTGMSSTDFFCKNSYPDSYENIPEYFSESTGDSYRLTDCLDFRYNHGGSDPDLSIYPLKPRTDFTVSYQYYVPRYDKLCLGTDGRFFVLQGTPSENPICPEDPQDAMVIYNLKHMAYTKDAKKHILREYVENKRYTMRDIGKLEKRIDNIEYYTSLTLLEKETADFAVVDSETGLDRFKNGFIVDSFRNHGIGDFRGPDYRCSIDPYLNELRPSFFSDAVELGLPSFDSNNFDKVGKFSNIVTLKKQEDVVVAKQTLATRKMNVNPYNVFSFLGKLNLNPESDFWKEKNALEPDIVMSPDATLNVPLPANSGEVVWGDWETTWTGESKTSTSTKVVGVAEYWAEAKHGQKVTSKDFGKTGKAVKTSKSDKAKLATPPFKRKEILETRTVTTTPVGQTRTGIKTSVNYATVTQDLGEKVVGVDAAQWIRKRTISFTAECMKPNTELDAYFDGVKVTEHCSPLGTNNHLWTDSYGKLGTVNSPATFTIPDSPRFRVGKRQFKLTSDLVNGNNSKPDTQAFANYSAEGLIETTQRTITSVRIPQIVSETLVDFNEGTQESSSVKTKVTDWIDPLSETILITDDPGCFLTKIDLWFAKKPTVATTPVKVQIRNTVNGYPGQYIIPGSEVILYPSSVNIIDTESSYITQESYWTSQKTTFEFEMPIYVQKGEYCFCVLSDCDEYEVLIATKSGQIEGDPQIDYRTKESVTKEPYPGSLFKSQNGSTWTAEQESDMTFVLYKAKFDTGNVQLTLENSDPGSDVLENNPLYFNEGTSKVRVYHKNHGMRPGEKVSISNSVVPTEVIDLEGDIDGNDYTISNVEHDSYVIDVVSKDALVTTFSGGSNVVATKERIIDHMHCIVQSLTVPGTDLVYDVKLTSASGQPPTLDSTATRIDVNTDYIPGRQCIIRNSLNDGGNPTFQLFCTFLTENENLTPVLDLTRTAVVCVQNRISNFYHNPELNQFNNVSELDVKTDWIPGANSTDFSPAAGGNPSTIAITFDAGATEASEKYNMVKIGQIINPTSLTIDSANRVNLMVIDKSLSGSVLTLSVDKDGLYNQTIDDVKFDLKTRYLDEITPYGGSAEAKYTTKKIQLESTSTALKILYAGVVPPGFSVYVYYKLQRIDDIRKFDDVPYTLVEPKYAVEPSLVEWKDYDYEVSGLPLFNAVAVKLVMLGGMDNADYNYTSWMAPRLKDLRVIALED